MPNYAPWATAIVSGFSLLLASGTYWRNAVLGQRKDANSVIVLSDPDSSRIVVANFGERVVTSVTIFMDVAPLHDPVHIPPGEKLFFYFDKATALPANESLAVVFADTQGLSWRKRPKGRAERVRGAIDT